MYRRGAVALQVVLILRSGKIPRNPSDLALQSRPDVHDGDNIDPIVARNHIVIPHRFKCSFETDDLGNLLNLRLMRNAYADSNGSNSVPFSLSCCDL